MWKIIKNKLDEVIVNKNKFSLWMKWEFVIEFANDTFWPYDYKFTREDCYYIDWLEDRWSSKFPLKNKEFDNTEILLETDDIAIFTWERWTLSGESKKFIDIVNINTEKKHRIFTDEVNLIYNAKNSIIVNANIDWIFKTIELDINSLEELKSTDEKLNSFFKCIYNKAKDIWFLLDFKNSEDEKNYQRWYFELAELWDFWIPEKFDRYEYKVTTNKSDIDIWELSCK